MKCIRKAKKEVKKVVSDAKSEVYIWYIKSDDQKVVVKDNNIKKSEENILTFNEDSLLVEYIFYLKIRVAEVKKKHWQEKGKKCYEAMAFLCIL